MCRMRNGSSWTLRDANSRGCPAAGVLAAELVQRHSLRGEDQVSPYLSHDLPPWTAVYQQARRWLRGGVFEDIAHDMRMILRLVAEREEQPSATILDVRTMQSTPESGGRAGYDWAKKKNGSKVHV